MQLKPTKSPQKDPKCPKNFWGLQIQRSETNCMFNKSNDCNSVPYLSITFCICVFTHVHYICIQNVLLSKTFKQHYHLRPSLAMTNFKVQTLFTFKNE